MAKDYPSQSLRRILAKKTNLPTKEAAKHARDLAATPSQNQPPPKSPQLVKPTSEQQPKFWLGFEVMKNLAIDQGLEELFTR